MHLLTWMGLCTELPLPPLPGTWMGVRRKAHGNRNVGTLHVRAAQFPEKERAREKVGAAGQTRKNRGITAHFREKVGIHTDHPMDRPGRTLSCSLCGQETCPEKVQGKPLLSSSVTADCIQVLALSGSFYYE